MLLSSSQWKCYTSKEDGRYNFQIDLAMQLIDYGIRLDWKGDADNPNNDAGKPAWVSRLVWSLVTANAISSVRQGGHKGLTTSHGRERERMQYLMDTQNGEKVCLRMADGASSATIDSARRIRTCRRLRRGGRHDVQQNGVGCATTVYALSAGISSFTRTTAYLQIL